MRVEFVVLTRRIILKGMMKFSATEADRTFKSRTEAINRVNRKLFGLSNVSLKAEFLDTLGTMYLW